MEKAISLEIDSEVGKDLMDDLIYQIIERQEPTEPFMDANLEQPTFLGGEGDQDDFRGQLSGSSSQSDVIKPELEKNTPSCDSLTASEQNEKLSKIPRAKRAPSTIRTNSASGANSLADEINKIWHKEMFPESGAPQDILQKKSSAILHRVVSTEGLILEHLGPVLDQITKNEDLIAKDNANLLKKDAEIAKLRKLNTDQKTEIANLTQQVKELEGKLHAASPQNNKELVKLRADFHKNCKVQKLWTQKEKDMTAKIQNLELQVKNIADREKILMEREKELTKIIEPDPETIRNLEIELGDAIHELRKAEAELETKRSVEDKNEHYKKKYQKKFDNWVKKERALTKQKFEDLKLWEDELRLREDCFARNSSVLEMRQKLMALLQARPQWHRE